MESASRTPGSGASRAAGDAERARTPRAAHAGTGRDAHHRSRPAVRPDAYPGTRPDSRDPVRRAAVVAALAAVAVTLSGCTWDPYAAQRSSSSSSGAAEPGGPSASSVSHEVTPSGPTGSPSGSSPGDPTGRPTGSSSGTSPTSGTSDAPRPTAAASSDPFGSSSRGPRPGADPDVSGDFDPDLPRASGAGTGEEVGTLADVALSSHDGFDRVVLELEGPDVPTWQVRYVARALGDPSGEPVAVDGDAVLQVLLDPVAYPESGTAPYEGPRRISRTGTTAVAQVVLSTFFEGELQVFVGVTDEPRPFRVYGMTDPARVVIEVERP